MLTTRALVLRAPGALEYIEVPLKDPEPHEAQVEVLFGGICGSDLHYWKHGRVGESVLSAPLVLGHEVIGRVTVPAADGSGPSSGTDVFIHPASACGRCSSCREGRENLCPTLSYLGSAARMPHCQGGFAQRLIVSTSRLLPTTGIAARDAALIEPAAIAWHAVSRAFSVGSNLRGRTAIIGSGPIGLLTAASARAKHRESTIASVDLYERPLAIAKKLGASPLFLTEDAAVALPDWRPDLVFETSGSVAGFNLALRSVAAGGTVIAVGQLPSLAETAIQLVVGRELVVSGSSRFFSEPSDVISALQEGHLNVSGIVTHEFAAADFCAAFESALDSAESSKVLLRFSESAS